MLKASAGAHPDRMITRSLTTALPARGGAALPVVVTGRRAAAAVCARAAADGPANAGTPASAAARRSVRASAAAVEASPDVQDGATAQGVEVAGAAFTLGDDRTLPPAGSTYAELRRRPVNYSPETRFTVDNVAEVDAQRFQLHPSVAYWRNWATRMDVRSIENSRYENSRAAATALRDEALRLFRESATSDAESAAYWAYHIARTGFFLGTSAASAVAHHLSERLSGGDRRTPFENLSANAQAEVVNRLYEGVGMYTQDLAAIKAGAYKLPWDMTTPAHRQYSPLYAARKVLGFVSEAIGTLDRRISRADTSNWFSSPVFPPYYEDNTFHYQTDGWLSQRSSEIYEFSTEALFFGRQDAMQRTALLALHEWLAETGRDPASLRLLEVACGTGRLHTFIKDNYPEMQTVASDLSPFYLARARDNVAYWKAQRQPGRQLGPGPGGAGTTFVQCAAEAVPAPDASFDVVVCVYVFHEMPEEARAAAAREWARVLRPGGLAILVDSCQLGDRPGWDATLGAFGDFNEPHYRNYIACDMGALFESAGFEPRTKYLASATKALSFTKRGVPSSPAAAAASDGAAASDAAAASDPGLN